MKKILIVDYDQNSLATLQGVFSGQGYKVVTATDGQTGWDKYNKESPDLVLMEAMLPKVHGFELCQRITSEQNSQATVFIMTGVYKDRVYRTEALRTYGASEYFEKPLKMAELLASVEAVLGKPEPKPAEAPARRPEPVPVEPRKRERPKDDDSIFSLPEDLDRLAREAPKVRKPAAPTVRRETPAEARLDAATDDLLKSVLIEHVNAAKTVAPKPAGGNGNGNGNGTADIDKFLKSALADLDLSKDKVKVPKTAPLPPQPVKAKPAPTPPPAVEPRTAPATAAPVVEQKPKPTPPPAPLPNVSFPEPAKADMKNTLTPGDPGSDVSPFFTPGKPTPAAPVERPKAPPAAKRAAPAPEPAHHEAVRPEAPRREPVHPGPARPEPVRNEPQKREEEAIAAADIFLGADEETEKKGFPKAVAIGLGIVAVAAVGFILLRPKRQPPAPENTQTAQQAVTPSNVTVPPPDETSAPEVKPAPVKPKVQPKAKPADTAPAGTEAILPAETRTSALPPITNSLTPGTAGSQSGPGSSPTATDAPAVKTETNPPAANTSANPAQGTVEGAGTPVETAAPAAAAPVNEGDLVDLGAVTELPKLIKSVNPVYPSAAQRIGLGGSITVNALIDEKGNVIDTGILKGIQDDSGLGRAAETAVRKWKFQPARKNGVAVKVWKSFVIVFKADTNPARTTE